MEGNGYIVSWCVGHLVGLCDASEYDEKYKKWRYDDLPIVPECWKHKVLEGTKKQFGILKKLMRDSKVDEVICATDAGREGELIFRLVYEQAGCKKPMKRLWISSMEEQAIKDGFASLKDGSCYDSLYQSALCRAKADWLVGINASRLFSVLYNQNLKVGRVQTPTLAMIVDRNQKIKEFTKEKYYMAHIKFDDMDAVTEHFQKKEDADKVAAECQERMCEVEKDDVKEKTVRPPKLYDLTTLQREANRMFGYTAQQTLDAVQEMYEQKLVTYPRTDSQYLTDEMGESTETLIQMLFGKMPYAEGLEYQPDVSKVLNSKKVSDHHAIIPTMEVAKADIGELKERNRKILYLISARVLTATAEKEVEEELLKDMMVIPNIIDPSVPIGKDDSENVEIEKFGEPVVPDFEVPYHTEIMENFDGIDLDSARRVAGNGFYYLMGDIARLHSAVISYARDFMINRGFTYCVPPFMIRSNVVTGVMSFAEMDAMMYKIEGEDLYLIGTSEHSMIGKFIDQIIPEEELPKTLTSYSPCFRKEKGAHGLEERGVYRIHQFEKQEMIVVCRPEESPMWFDKLWQNTVDLFRSLDIPVRTLECCSGDLADLKVKSLDVEAWSPRQKKYFEVGSCSNLGDAQARRLKIRVNGKDGKKYLAHTLNNTVVAPPRMLIAFLENNLNADGSVSIPKALQPYMGGMTKIEKKHA